MGQNEHAGHPALVGFNAHIVVSIEPVSRRAPCEAPAKERHRAKPDWLQQLRCPGKRRGKKMLTNETTKTTEYSHNFSVLGARQNVFSNSRMNTQRVWLVVWVMTVFRASCPKRCRCSTVEDPNEDVGGSYVDKEQRKLGLDRDVVRVRGLRNAHVLRSPTTLKSQNYYHALALRILMHLTLRLYFVYTLPRTITYFILRTCLPPSNAYIPW